MPLPQIPPALRNKLVAAALTSSVAIAGALVGWYEGRVYVPYVDPAGILTVCEGHTGTDIIAGHRYTDSECDSLKADDLAQAGAAVDRNVTVPLSVWQRAALIDFVFNVGEGRLKSSTLLRKLNSGDYFGACAEYDRWTKATVRGHKVSLPGLVKRRDAEEWVCLQ